MRTTVLAVGRTQPPYADDVQHYQKLLARHTRLELVEVREEQRVDGRIPRDAYVCLLAADETQFAELAYGLSALEFWPKMAPHYLGDEEIVSASPFLRGRRLVSATSRSA